MTTNTENSAGTNNSGITILGIRFDKTINLGGACALVVILYSLYSGFNSIKAEFMTMQKQHNLMWKHFLIHEPDLTKDEVADFLKENR